MEWTREKTLLLINEYRKRRGLWDMTHDDYRKKEIKSKLLMEVSNNLGGGIPTVEIEKKFHTLRTQYHRELNRIKRKNPYNSKWFGFKNLQFLSSPNACRANNKGRVKEITEDGTVTTKYILREAQLDTCEGANSNNNGESDEFVTINRKPATITYEAVSLNSNNLASNSRSHELEKLIEETTKDVDIDDAKPKTIESTSYSGTTNGVDITATTNDIGGMHAEESKLNDEHMETIDMQASGSEEAELTYQATTNAQQQHETALHTHHYIKIQRRDSDHMEEYYEEQQQQPQQQHITPHIHGLVSAGGKRIYYETTTPPQTTTTTILAATTSPIVNTTPIQHVVTGNGKIHQTTIKPISRVATMQQQQQQIITSPPQQQQAKQHKSDSLSPTQQQTPQRASNQMQPRDEFCTYGEYVANEMRGITNREILTALKHKINTALFEASMAELKN